MLSCSSIYAPAVSELLGPDEVGDGSDNLHVVMPFCGFFVSVNDTEQKIFLKVFSNSDILPYSVAYATMYVTPLC